MDDRKSDRIDSKSLRVERPDLPGNDSGQPTCLSSETRSGSLCGSFTSESSYRTLFNAADVALFVHDVTSREILDVNPAACAMYGFTPQEARRFGVAEFSSGEPGYTQQDADQQIAEAVRRGRNVFEWHARRKSGEYFWAEVTLRPVVIDGCNRVLAAVRDVTERRRTQEELRRQHDFAESLIETAQAIVLVLDPEGRIIRFNRYLEDLSGYRLSETCGGVWFDIFLQPCDRPRIRERFARAVSDVPTEGRVNAIVTKDGRQRLIQWYDRALKDDAGNVVAVVAIGHDITERQRAEEALRRAHDELEIRVAQRTEDLAAANRQLRKEIADRQRAEARERQLEADLAHVGRVTTMGEMASGLAHELNQPLAAIVLQSEVIARIAAECPDSVPPDVVKAIEFITRQSHRAGDLIRHMRSFVRHAIPKRAMVTMAEVVDEVLPLVHRDLDASNIALEIRIGDPMVAIEADKVQLQQVLLNLVRNAIEAMDGADAVDRRLRIERRVCGDMVEVAVHDTGRGIEAEHLDKLFKAFYSTKADGMGMGLAISRSIVESHGGRIWATPNPERGTTFTFTLPIATEGEENGSKTSRLSGG